MLNTNLTNVQDNRLRTVVAALNATELSHLERDAVVASVQAVMARAAVDHKFFDELQLAHGFAIAEYLAGGRVPGGKL